jgi:O-antigen/teichoic acid export membrane protein
MHALRSLARFGVPLVPATMAWIVGDAFIRSSIAREASLSTLGEYGIAYRVASALAILVTGFAVAWQPYLYRSAVTDALSRARRTAPGLLATLAWGAMLLTLMGREVVGIAAGPNYENAVTGIAALSGGIVALGVFTLLGVLAGAISGTGRVGTIALIGMMLQAALGIVLVAPLGLSGAALASLAGYVLSALLLVWSTHFLRLDVHGLSLLAMALLAALGLIAASSLSSSALGLRLAASLIVTVIFGLALLRLRRQSTTARD